MQINASTDDYNIVEEEINNLVTNKAFQSSHPNTGFPVVYNRRKSEKKSELKLEPDLLNKSLGNEDCELETSLAFNLTQNDILKLRWTNPLGEDVNDWDSTSESDMNLHNLRFNFEGSLCDNSNFEEKYKHDDLYFYKGLHHHSNQGEFEGYTIPELMHLSRSSSVSQRCIAIRTLGNIFLKIREYHIFNHQFGKAYHKYLLGYLFGIHRWYKYLTGDLSIHYLLLNMLFHESYASRTAEHSVIALNNLLSGGQFPMRPLNIELLETSKFRLLNCFMTPSEFIFELLDEKLLYYPSYFRYNIICQKLEFLNQLVQKKFHNVRYNDLQDEEHLIKFDLPDGRSLELIRDTMQEIFKYVPSRYDNGELSIQKNYLFIFLCKMAQNKVGTLDSRISSINIIRLFVQRECIYDQSICLETLKEMLNSLGDEIFNFSSSELASQNYSNSNMAKLLFSFIYLISTYLQSLYNGDNDTDNTFIKAQKNFLGNFLITPVLQILRIVILAVLGLEKLHPSGINEFIQLSLVEGTKIIGIMSLKNIYLEDLSIYCKDLIRYFAFLDLDDSVQSFISYYLYALGCNILVFSKNHEIEHEHLQYIQVLNQFIVKINEKVKIFRKELSIVSYEYFNLVLLTISIIRFQVLLAERSNFDLVSDTFQTYLELIGFCESFLEAHSKQDFDLDLLTLESGFLLEIEMGITNIQSILNNNQIYGEFYFIILISTFLKELSRLFLLTIKGKEISSSYLHDLKPSFNLLSDIYHKLSRNYILSNYLRKDNSDFHSEANQLFSYELCYFETLNMNDSKALVVNNNIVKKNSIYLQLLNSNMFHIYLLIYTNINHINTTNTSIPNSLALNSSIMAFRYQQFISEIENSNYDPQILYEKLFILLFSSKNLEEYSLVLFWILKLEGQISESFYELYDKLLCEYSSCLNNTNLLTVNPFIYSVNIVYNQIMSANQPIPSSENPFLFYIMKKVLNKQLIYINNSEFVKDLIIFLSKYILECSINQIIHVSKIKEPEMNSINFKLIGDTILNYVKLSLELQGYIHISKEKHLESNKNFQDSLLEMVCNWGQNREIANVTIYDLNNKKDNECLRKLIDSLISAFCDSNMYFSEELLDCFYFLFTFFLFEIISDSNIVLKIISDIKIMKLLLYNKKSDISCILRQINSVNTKVSEASGGEQVVNLISEIITLYKDAVSQSTLLVLLLIYFNYFSGSKLELIKEITKLYEETEIEYLNRILVGLNKD
ncbi:synthetic antigen [Cryptosporidium ubiquitum]|uniref:synthetic antigen n=1 Tax=Cryptosporidium ubiquitum TaxID=857276 RepID=UPI00090F2079|nr:synthetic antigen [Cryptosporidium ubiquitum]OII74304.1 synthetic antigen [Cryptosporidium ubiquitum]